MGPNVLKGGSAPVISKVRLQFKSLGRESDSVFPTHTHFDIFNPILGKGSLVFEDMGRTATIMCHLVLTFNLNFKGILKCQVTVSSFLQYWKVVPVCYENVNSYPALHAGLDWCVLCAQGLEQMPFRYMCISLLQFAGLCHNLVNICPH